jgi:hypothetical protein
MNRCCALGALLAAVFLGSAGCSDSSIKIRVVYPSEVARTAAPILSFHVVDPQGGEDCDSVAGRDGSSLGAAELLEQDFDLEAGEPLVLEGVPLRSILVSALAYNRSRHLLLDGCAAAEPGSGESADLVITLGCLYGGSGCLQGDYDGDGVSTTTDCDDNDPCRSPNIKEAANLCDYQNKKKLTSADFALPQACTEKLAKEGKTLTAPYCGDGADEDCDERDVACSTDEDCDGYAPCKTKGDTGCDCDDSDASINPGTKETCDGKDNNCDGKVDEGCVPCDIDGDGYASPGTTDKTCKLPKTDTDDYDAGINPGTTSDTGGAEGGTVKTALREFCSYKVTKNSTSTTKVRARDIDHDGDNLIATADGCPSDTCDADGDGFQNSSCSPPKSKLDCDDTDPHIFPGAPEKCGDGIAQNCVADISCSCDKDGDGYCSPDDCNDSDANIHPWATEICDHKDNDCDGLIDEGNPDSTGVLIPTNVKTCNDDNDGQCAPSCTVGTANCSSAGKTLSGICACSALKPVSTIDSSDRVSCSGEDLTASGSQRCFGATQPAAEQCIPGYDYDCDGTNCYSGKGWYADYGTVCSTSKGTCVAGTMTKCDCSNPIANATIVEAVLKAQGLKFNKYWVCSSGTRFPLPEVCDGKDDDCDGFKTKQELTGTDVGSTELDEKDVDADKYVACTGCTKGSGRTDLDSSLTGCGDCNDNNSSIYPGAYEYCNNVDDNCTSGDDGKDECTGTYSCCSSLKACKQLKTDAYNCGTCSYKCPTSTSDTCVNGSCVCGAAGTAACTSGLDCTSGSCTCISGGNCNGCCDGSSTCLTLGSAQSSSKCGVGGASCKSCSDSNECTTDTCSSAGACTNPNKSNGTGCTSGTCLGGTCCTGCVSGGSTCAAGSSTSACGLSGSNCKTCTAPACQGPTCNSSGNCGTSNNSDGSSCSGGLCYSGSCCTGCYNGSSCVALGSESTSACGSGGASCQTCSTAAACKDPDCASGGCTTKNATNWSSTNCSGGTCLSGACCTGCWYGSVCYALGGQSATTCGAGGVTCSACSTAAACKSPDCTSGGSCTTKNATDGSSTNCSGGTCLTGSCCTGCWSGSTCAGGGSTSACGAGGTTCQTCSTSNECKTPYCSGGLCGTSNVSDGTTCTGGSCCGGTCYTTGCCQGSTHYSGNTNARCGSGGGTCTTCSGSQNCVGGSCVAMDSGTPVH